MTDEELDVTVAVEVLGLERKFSGLLGKMGAQHLPYSTDMTCAWKLVEKMRGTHDLTLETFSNLEYIVVRAVFRADAGILPGEASAASAPRAICLAALKAVGVDVDRPESHDHDGRCSSGLCGRVPPVKPR